MPRAIKGALVKCDPSIRALILKIDAESHDIVIEELDDTHLVVDQNRIPFVKAELARILAQNSYNPLDEDEA
ncbi:RNA polymerase II general transcription factor TFIIH component [Komagataella phaffii CBS 7435]|uniref:General transcription and DNA repair factor IIH subunit TFB5 n=2 Tax=Komagataella phaffii TaxID=460519 RepID=C4R6R2_KOMPG|nr:Component of the RNA polymerase II general transcription and DNA repair factor TFIIH [Komagataella phaffii GS115]CAH2451370.1 RNA polymerase II general transcription factor TFIIH component [Komagataella phaffii CBS 7435]CAY71287.1 Component of the RNA polymerase II general transcription and DNA repair factor TFIIH [Komagataella phaffii GS115]CCA41106.1 RNA polymerase II general transcription factor TFIIH component [Komagataella phaffii CBS 7435]